MDSSKILTREEVAAVLADLARRCKRKKWSRRARVQRIIFRLSCCCGCRAKEICGLNLSDVEVGGGRPLIRIRKNNTKGREGRRRARVIPLWWDSGTLADLAEWKAMRIRMGATPNDPFVCSLKVGTEGNRISKPAFCNRIWRAAIRALGPERVSQLSVHCGRHSFISHALYAGVPLVDVRDAAGHRSIATTSIYLHAVPVDVKVNIFSMER